MTEQVTAAEIADLMHRIQCPHEHRPIDPADQAAVLATKADLLGRIADQRAAEYGSGEHAIEVREIADDARAIATNATAWPDSLQQPAGGAKSEENPPRL